jgi:phosphate transport system permease protein
MSAVMQTSGSFSTQRLSKARRRRVVNAIALTLSLSAMAFGLFWLIG